MKKLIFLFCCLTFSILSTYAQQNESNEKENNIENEVEEALNQAAKKIESLFKKKPKKNREQEVEEEREPENREEPSAEEREASEEAAEEILNSIYGSDSDEDYVPTTNEFIGQFTMQMEMFKNEKPDKNNPMVMEFHFAKSQTGMIMNAKAGQTGRMIMDLTNNSMIVISYDQKGNTTAFKMRRPNTSKILKDVTEDYEITKTSEYKNIDGYRCQKVLIYDSKEKSNTTAWITKDVDLDWKKVSESLMAGKVDSGFTGLDGLEGFTIQSETISGNGKERHTMKMSNIKAGDYDRSVFDTSGIEIMSIPGFGG